MQVTRTWQRQHDSEQPDADVHGAPRPWHEENDDDDSQDDDDAIDDEDEEDATSSPPAAEEEEDHPHGLRDEHCERLRQLRGMRAPAGLASTPRSARVLLLTYGWGLPTSPQLPAAHAQSISRIALTLVLPRCPPRPGSSGAPPPSPPGYSLIAAVAGLSVLLAGLVPQSTTR